MVTLKNNMYKNIASILASTNDDFKSSQNLLVIARILQAYPSKSLYYILSVRLLHYIEQNIKSIDLIIEVMKTEAEDEEIIENATMLSKNPTIKTSQEVLSLMRILLDYVKYKNVLKKKDTFLKALDIINDDDIEVNMSAKLEVLQKSAAEVVDAMNGLNISETHHTFDTRDKNGMKTCIARAKDSRTSNRVILTGIRALNSLLSPGYVGGNVYIYAGLPGNYKSGILLKAHVDTLRYNEHIVQTCNGKTPISMYISMENTMDQTILRLWSLLFPTADIAMFNVDEACDMIDKELTCKGMRSVILYYGYREKSVGDIARIIESFNNDKEEVVILSLDYIKRVRPTRTDAAAVASEKTELNAIMNELKSMIAVRFDIPVISGHQLNRMGATAVDEMIAKGGHNKTADALGRANIGTAWEVMEDADALFIVNIENNGESKMLMIKAAKRRDLDPTETDSSIIAIQHPFVSINSFALLDDILENVSVSVPIYIGRKSTNFMANI